MPVESKKHGVFMTYLITDPLCHLHEMPGEPEQPARLRVIENALRNAGLWEQLEPLPARDATRAELELVHTPEHIDLIASAGEGEGTQLDWDTFAGAHTYAAALRAAGGAVAAVEAVLANPGSSAFVLTRPPGHHATPDRAMGFCFFSNAAIAAVASGKRAMIVDWDLHHGNGTEECVSDRDDVFFLSLHRHPLYPGTGKPEDPSAPNVLNVPLGGETTAADFHAAFEKALSQIAERFDPELIIISCGFDAHHAEPVGGGLGLEAPDYFRLTETLFRKFPNTNGLVSILEGGYNLNEIGACAVEHVKALLRLKN